MACEPEFALRPGEHVCAIVRNRRERDRLLVPFLERGLIAGYKCLVSLPGQDVTTAIHAIGGGIDVDSCRRRQQLELLEHDGDGDSAEATTGGESAESWRCLVSGATRDGYPATHLSTSPGLTTHPRMSGIDALLDHEARIRRLIDIRPVAALCIHQEREADGGRVLTLMRTHPRLIIGNVELRNPYYERASPIAI